MTREHQGIAVWLPADAPETPEAGDWIDRLEYTVSQVLGYAVLATAAVFGVVLLV